MSDALLELERSEHSLVVDGRLSPVVQDVDLVVAGARSSASSASRAAASR